MVRARQRHSIWCILPLESCKISGQSKRGSRNKTHIRRNWYNNELLVYILTKSIEEWRFKKTIRVLLVDRRYLRMILFLNLPLFSTVLTGCVIRFNTTIDTSLLILRTYVHYC